MNKISWGSKWIPVRQLQLNSHKSQPQSMHRCQICFRRLRKIPLLDLYCPQFNMFSVAKVVDPFFECSCIFNIDQVFNQALTHTVQKLRHLSNWPMRCVKE